MISVSSNSERIDTILRDYKKKMSNVRLSELVKKKIAFIKPSKRRREEKNKAIRTQKYKQGLL